MTKWEYLTAPILVHAAKQILDNFGADGWELVQIAPGMNPENLVGYFKRPVAELMSTLEDRLAELGLARARGGQAGGGVRPGRAHRHARLHLRPAADARRRADARPARSAARSRQEEAVACAQQCALNAIAAVKAEIGDLDDGEAGRQGRRASSPRRPTSPASRRSPTAPPSCSARSSATPACTRAPRSASPCCRWTPRSRSRSSSRSDGRCGVAAAAEHLVEHARAFADGTATPAEPRNAATVVLLRPGTRRGPRSTCCAGRPRWRSPAGCASSPAAASTRATSTPPSPGPARPRPSGPRGLRHRRGHGARAGLRRRARDVRGVRRAAGRAVGRRRWSRTPPATTGRPTGSRSRRASCRSPSSSTRRGLVLRTDLLGAWSALADAGVRAAPLPHLVLRRRAAGRASAPATCRPSRRPVTWLPARGARATPSTRASSG